MNRWLLFNFAKWNSNWTGFNVLELILMWFDPLDLVVGCRLDQCFTQRWFIIFSKYVHTLEKAVSVDWMIAVEFLSGSRSCQVNLMSQEVKLAEDNALQSQELATEVGLKQPRHDSPVCPWIRETLEISILTQISDFVWSVGKAGHAKGESSWTCHELWSPQDTEGGTREVIRVSDHFNYQTRWETTRGHVSHSKPKICQDEASLWVSRSEWVEREYQNAPSLDIFEAFWCVCCPNVVLSSYFCVLPDPCCGMICIQGSLEASKAVKRCYGHPTQMLQVQGFVITDGILQIHLSNKFSFKDDI